jgi:hypothetical protein
VNQSHNRSCAGFEESDRVATLSKPLAEIENALDTLLTALLKERAREWKAAKPTELRVISAADLVQMPILSDQEAWQERIIEQPLAGALELAIHEIGEVLFKKGGTDLMRASLERVASRRRKTYGKRISICDVQWEGIGGKWWP